jgi:uncharacterized membrane protein
MSDQFNPYAAPMAAPPRLPAQAPFGAPQPWGVGEAFSIAWERFKQNWAVAVFPYPLTLVVTQSVGAVPRLLTLSGAVRAESVAAGAISLGSAILGLVLSSYFQVGLTRIWLQIARGESPSFGLLFSGGDRFLPMFLASILAGLAIFAGLLLFIVPGVILGLGLFFYQYYVVDANMSPTRALKASWVATKGQKGDILVLGLAGGGLFVLGVLMFVVGLFATVPIFYIAASVVYTRISGLGVVPPWTGSAGVDRRLTGL